jgi:hypothetical protein
MCDVNVGRGWRGPQLNRGAGDERRFRDTYCEKNRWGVEIQRIFSPITPTKHRHKSRIVWADGGGKGMERIGPQLGYRAGWDEMRVFERRKKKLGWGQDKRALKNGRCPFSQLLIVALGAFSPSSLTIRLPREPNVLATSNRGPAISVLLLSLRHSRISHNMFPRFLAVPTCWCFRTDVCASSTEASTYRLRAFRSQLWVVTTPMSHLHQVHSPQTWAFRFFRSRTRVPAQWILVSSSDKNPERPAASRQIRASMSLSFVVRSC